MIDGEALLQRMGDGEALLGVWTTYPAPGIVERVAADWDMVWVDCQHGQFGYNDAINHIRAAASIGVATALRPPTHDAGLLGAYADMGSQVVMVPMAPL